MAALPISRSEAKANGVSRYRTNKPCRHGHIADRITANGICVECSKLIEHKWKSSNPDRIRAKWRKQAERHRAENPERINKNKKNWEVANPEKVCDKKKRWDAANPDRRRQHGKKWRDANPDYIKNKNRTYKTVHAERLAPINTARAIKWAKDNPEKKRKHVNDRRSREKNAEGSHTLEELKEQLERQDNLCIGCYADLSELRKRTIDHIIPLSKGGSQWIENIQWLCKSCNSRKHDKRQLEWLCETARILR